MSGTYRVIIGDARNMKEVADNSVHLIVTSPPYWQLKDYGEEAQIGFHQSYEAYINHLNLVWQESHRVLHPGCRMAINIGDQFARAVYYGRYKVIPIRTEIIKFAETIGFDYMGAIIWQKKTTMHTTGGATIMGSYPFPRNGIIEIDYEFILLFKKPGNAPQVSKERKEAARLSKEEWKTYFSGHWYFPGDRQRDHIAVFPVELPKRLIKMFTFPGETVLDPFLGSGTTIAAAQALQRDAIGYEINPAYLDIIKRRIGLTAQLSLSPDNIIIERQDRQQVDWPERIAKLPYQFQDVTRFDKKVDPRRLNFGSRISDRDKGGTQRKYLRVKRVITPEVIELNNGVRARLIGVKTEPEQAEAAVKFLEAKTKGQYVYLQFDDQKYDAEGNLMAYLYLRNRTFVNAHLLKAGLAVADTAGNYRYKSKFLQYGRKSHG